jgi:hypothetical protein
MDYKLVAPRVLVVRHEPVPIRDREWDEFMDVLREQVEEAGSDQVYMLIRAEGSGGPDVNQRSVLGEVCSQGQVTAAVLTDSITVRGIVTAIGWIGSLRIRAFKAKDEAGALAFLALPEELEALVLAASRAAGRKAKVG